MEEKNKQILLILQEECAEVIQIISKIHRFGIDNRHPDSLSSNQARLEEEIGDLRCMINLLLKNNMISEENIRAAENRKIEKLKKWSNIYE